MITLNILIIIMVILFFILVGCIIYLNLHKKCDNPLLKAPECTVCNNPLLKAPECTVCNNPLLKAPECTLQLTTTPASIPTTPGILQFTTPASIPTTPGTDCSNPLLKAPECTDCINPLLKAPECTDCINPLLKAPKCTDCINPLLKAPKCTDCINPLLKAPECTDCINPLLKAPECTDCINPLLKAPGCKTCINTRYLAPDCKECIKTGYSKESNCTECINKLYDNSDVSGCYKCKNQGFIPEPLYNGCVKCRLNSRDPIYGCNKCLDKNKYLDPYNNCVDCLFPNKVSNDGKKCCNIFQNNLDGCTTTNFDLNKNGVYQIWNAEGGTRNYWKYVNNFSGYEDKIFFAIPKNGSPQECDTNMYFYIEYFSDKNTYAFFTYRHFINGKLTALCATDNYTIQAKTVQSIDDIKKDMSYQFIIKLNGVRYTINSAKYPSSSIIYVKPTNNIQYLGLGISSYNYLYGIDIAKNENVICNL